MSDLISLTECVLTGVEVYWKITKLIGLSSTLHQCLLDDVMANEGAGFAIIHKCLMTKDY